MAAPTVVATVFEDHRGEVQEECVVSCRLYGLARTEVAKRVIGVSGGADGERICCDIEGYKGGQEEHAVLCIIFRV